MGNRGQGPAIARGIQARGRKVSANALWKIVMLRGLGHDEAGIAARLTRSGDDISSRTVSYHLGRLRSLTRQEENEYRVLGRIMVSSSEAIPYLMMAIADDARRGRRH